MNTYPSYSIEDFTLLDQIGVLAGSLWKSFLDDEQSPHRDLVDSLSIAIDSEGTSETFDIYDKGIKEATKSYIQIGVFLSRIARNCLYKAAGMGSFGEYCRKSLGRNSSYCCRLMRAAKVAMQLMMAGVDRLPSNEAQCRPLTSITDENELATKWQEVLDRADQRNNQAMRGVITAGLVNEVVNGTTDESETEKKKKLSVSAAVHDKLCRLAKKTGKTIERLIDELIDDQTLESNREATEQLSRWQDDLKDLIQESPAPEPAPEPLPQPASEPAPAPEPLPQPAPEPAPAPVQTITKPNLPSEQISYQLLLCQREMSMGLCTEEQMRESVRNLGYEMNDGGEFVYVGRPAVNPCKGIIDRIKQQLKTPKPHNSP